MDRIKQQKDIPSLEKGLRVLEFISNHQEVSLEEIQKKLKISRTTLYRILNTLQKNVYIVKKNNKDSLSSLYKISHYQNVAKLREIVEPYLQKLSATVGETVECAVLEYNRIFYILKIEHPNRSVSMLFEEGKYYTHMHASGICKVILAYLDEAQVKKIIKINGMEKFTPKTITDFKLLKKSLEKIKKEGVGIEKEENRIGIRRISAPIFLKGRILGAIGFVGPISMVYPISEEKIINYVKKTAISINKELENF